MPERPLHTTVPARSEELPTAQAVRWIGNLFRYSWVGIGINLAGYLAFVGLVCVGMPAKLVVSTLYAGGVAIGYVLHRNVSFRSRMSHRMSVPAYIGAHLIGYLTNLGLLMALSDGLGWDVRLVQIVAIGVVALELFVLMHFFVFRMGIEGPNDP